MSRIRDLIGGGRRPSKRGVEELIKSIEELKRQHARLKRKIAEIESWINAFLARCTSDYISGKLTRIQDTALYIARMKMVRAQLDKYCIEVEQSILQLESIKQLAEAVELSKAALEVAYELVLNLLDIIPHVVYQMSSLCETIEHTLPQEVSKAGGVNPADVPEEYLQEALKDLNARLLKVRVEKVGGGNK